MTTTTDDTLREADPERVQEAIAPTTSLALVLRQPIDRMAMLVRLEVVDSDESVLGRGCLNLLNIKELPQRIELQPPAGPLEGVEQAEMVRELAAAHAALAQATVEYAAEPVPSGRDFVRPNLADGITSLWDELQQERKHSARLQEQIRDLRQAALPGVDLAMGPDRTVVTIVNTFDLGDDAERDEVVRAFKAPLERALAAAASHAVPVDQHTTLFRCRIGQECHAEPAGKLLAAITSGLWSGLSLQERPRLCAVSIDGCKAISVTSKGPLAPEHMKAIEGACAEYDEAVRVMDDASMKGGEQGIPPR